MNNRYTKSFKRIQKEVFESIYDIPLEDRISYYQEFDDWFFSDPHEYQVLWVPTLK